jgi:molybdate transport system substrate-binding protein
MIQKTLKIISSMATKEVLQILAHDFKALHASGAAGFDVAVESIGGVNVNRRVRGGEMFDLVVLAADAIDVLIGEGHLRTGSRVDFVSSGIVAAVKTGSRLFDITTELALKQAILNAKTVSYSTGPSGVYLEQLFVKWGIMEQIKPRLVIAPPGIPVGGLLASGEAELGFQQLSELISLPGLTLLGPLPPEVQLITTFSAGIGTNAVQLDIAHQFLAFIKTEATSAGKARAGMQSV